MQIQDSIALSPAQQRALDSLISVIPIGNIFHCYSRTGRGRTSVLKKLHVALGGEFLSIKDYVVQLEHYHPLQLEESLYRILAQALAEHHVVVVDDLHVATAVSNGCGHSYPRSGLLDGPMTVLANYATESGKKLILGTDGQLPAPMEERCFAFSVGNFSAEDYRHLCLAFSVVNELQIDFDKVHRFAPKLNAYQLLSATVWCEKFSTLTTADFIEYLRTQRLTSNVTLGEVTDVDLSDLKGVDDVLQSLEANIAIPLENDELAIELALKPKRGVLLVGPPGTGKTSIGRALAHRLKGKFFLIDGTFISGTRDFYGLVHRVFDLAKENAPSVIFIDDSDVIFESGQEHGLYRYLLTMLDGLESQSAGRVCVMMTAMDVGNLPPALVRSGRIELWLEMSLPNGAARAQILDQQINHAPQPLNDANIAEIVAATEGFTGADLRRTFEDGKALYAFDRVSASPLQRITDYYLTAVESIIRSKKRYAEAESRANANRRARPVWFNPDSRDEYYDVEYYGVEDYDVEDYGVED